MASALLYTLSAFILLVLSAVSLIYKYWFSYWKKRGLNYLEPSFPFGNAANAAFGKSSFGEIYLELYTEIRKKGWKHGGVYYFGKPIYMPVDNELVKHVLVSDFLSFPNHGLYLDEVNDPLSGHIFNMEGYRWKNVRAKLPAAFTAARMKQYVVIMEKTSHVLLEKLDQHVNVNKSINIKDLLSRFTIDIISACAFGMQTNTLNHENETLVKESRVFFDYQWSRINNTLVLLIPRRILSMFNFTLYTKVATNYFNKMFKDIQEHREKTKNKRNDLLDILIDLCDETKEHPDFNGKGKMDALNFNEFASQMYVFFEAGFETSSSTQTFALYELGANKTIQDKLRTEINDVLKRYDGKVTYESVNEMEYLDRVVDETLRKYPIFPILPRSCVKDYNVPGTDIVIEKGTFVMVSNWGIHNDETYYPNPTKFDPDRFLPENKSKRPFCSYVPFGEGPRICIGKRFGLWQTKIGLISIVKNYNITISKEMKLPLTFEKTGIILNAKGGVWLDLEKIKIENK